MYYIPRGRKKEGVYFVDKQKMYDSLLLYYVQSLRPSFARKNFICTLYISLSLHMTCCVMCWNASKSRTTNRKRKFN